MITDKINVKLLSILLLMGFWLSSGWVQAAPGDGKDTKVECSIYDAEYRPHPSYKPKKDVDLVMTIHKSLDKEEAGGSIRSEDFFEISAYRRDDKTKLSTLRMGSACGTKVCHVSAYHGQFGSKHEMKQFDTDLSFDDFLALDRSFFPVSWWGPEAPYAYIFPQTARKLNYEKLKPNFKSTTRNFVKYYTDKNVFPDFGGYDVWILGDCSND